jgi:superfamily II DNA or RNA helicase
VFLKYDKGSIILSGICQIPYTVFDPRTNHLRAQALYYSNIISYLQQSGIEYEDSVMDIIPTPYLNISNSNIKLSFRTYQKQAIKNWVKAGKKGCIVLPTGSGKTIIAIKIIEIINSASIIIVPTIDLMNQWSNILTKYFKDVKIGNIGGGTFTVSGVTVSTYDSAYLKAPLIGNKFDLLIFDELHHMAAPGYKTIAEQFTSRYRLGLTATYEREDNLHLEFPKLVGGIVFHSRVNELTRDKYLAPFVIERRYVKLLQEEKNQYQKNYSL